MHACMRVRVLCAKLLLCCCPRTWPAHDPGAMQRQAKLCVPKITLHPSRCILYCLHCTLHLNSTHLSSSHLIWPRRRTTSNPHVSTHMATEHDNNHAASTLRFAIKDSKTPFNYAHMNKRTLCDVLLCDVPFCDVLLCDVLLWFIFWCHVLLCDVLFCVVMWCIVVQYVVK